MPRTDKDLSKSDMTIARSRRRKNATEAEIPVSSGLALVETDIRSPAAQTWAVRSKSGDARAWMQAAPQCELLGEYHILHLGLAIMPAPFQIVRTNLSGSYFLASLAGEGRVLVDGKWLPSRPGHAFLLPPKTMHAFFTPPGKQWKFCWVRYQESRGQLPVARANSPVLARFETAPFEMAVMGLFHEASGKASPRALELWARLVHSYVQRFAQSHEMDPRLKEVWDIVADQLDQPWTIAQLARRLQLSEKQFQRLCRRELGRTPQQQLMWLRMRRACELLADGTTKIQTVAAAVGYQNPFVFSSTFKRILGWSPSEYPGSRSSQSPTR